MCTILQSFESNFSIKKSQTAGENLCNVGANYFSLSQHWRITDWLRDII